MAVRFKYIAPSPRSSAWGKKRGENCIQHSIFRPTLRRRSPYCCPCRFRSSVGCGVGQQSQCWRGRTQDTEALVSPEAGINSKHDAFVRTVYMSGSQFVSLSFWGASQGDPPSREPWDKEEASYTYTYVRSYSRFVIS